jgi:hypothetical protein
MMRDADPSSIECIQSRAPGLSRSDFDFVEERMRSGELFPGITDPRRRSDLALRLLTTKELIPSLWTLICDIRYLKRPATVLNTLLPPKEPRGRLGINNSLRERFLAHWKDPGGESIEVQRTASSFTTIPRNDLEAFEVCYQQLWLCSCRIWKKLNAYGSIQLATLAFRLGFSNRQIQQELKKDPNYAMIEGASMNALAVLRPNERFAFDANQARPAISAFKDYLSAALEIPATTTSPFITVHGPGEPLARRCGYGPSDTKDRNHLFLEKIHTPLQEYQNGGDEISSFFVKRSRHLAFFGPLDLAATHWDQRSSVYTARETSTRTSSLYTAREQITADDVLDEESFYRAYSGIVATYGAMEPPEQTREIAQATSDETREGRVPERFITFEEAGRPPQQVIYEREQINGHAEAYALQGKKLKVRGGGYVVWRQCFDALKNPRDSTVVVVRPAPAHE